MAAVISIFCNSAALGLGETTEPITVYAIALDYRLNEIGTKHYNVLLNELALRGLKFKTIVRPLRRSQLNFKSDANSCIFPATINAVTKNDKSMDTTRLVSSSSIDKISLKIFTQPHKPVVTKLQDLSGKKVALLNGINPDIVFSNIDVTVEYTANEEVRVKMLNAERIDAILGFLPDILLAAEDHGLPVPNYSPELSIVRDEEASFVCHKSHATSKFINKANQLIRELKISGKLQEILGPHAKITPTIH